MNKINVLNKMLEAARLAAKKILEIYHSDNLGVEIKDDNSPVTLADEASNDVIIDVLSKTFPTVAILSEERSDDMKRLDNPFVFVIDPLDGTKDFIARNDQFTINIALVENHVAVIGVIMLPVQDEIFYAIKGEGAFLIRAGAQKQIFCSKKERDITVYTSNFHFNEKEAAMIEKHRDKIQNVLPLGSSIKGCYIAEGKAELTYRFSPNTKEWDTAAMQVIVEESGAFLLKPDGQPIKYNRPDVYNREGYVICNSRQNFLL